MAVRERQKRVRRAGWLSAATASGSLRVNHLLFRFWGQPRFKSYRTSKPKGFGGSLLSDAVPGESTAAFQEKMVLIEHHGRGRKKRKRPKRRRKEEKENPTFREQLSHEMEELWFANNDIPIDVLSRLPTKTLLGLKCVSKEWYRLISDRSFIRHQLKRTELVSGFFFQERFQWCDVDIKSISYIPIKMEATEVQRSVFNFLPESVVLLAVSNGLICCRSCFPSPQPVIYICNPLNKEWVTLQWPAPDKRSSLGLAFDPIKDPIDEFTNFKVVRIHQTVSETEGSCFSFDMYSSKRGTWSTSGEKCQCHHNLFKNKGIFIGGAMYWLTDGDQILMFDIENELSWLITVPFPLMQFDSIPEMCIGESEGKLHYVLVSEDGLQVWVLEDYFDFTWAIKYSIALDEMERENSEFLCNIQQRVASRVAIDMTPWMDPLAFKDGLLFMRVAAKVYLYNFETRKLEELCTLSMLGPNSMISPIVLPYPMSLVPLGCRS